MICQIISIRLVLGAMRVIISRVSNNSMYEGFEGRDGYTFVVKALPLTLFVLNTDLFTF